MAVARQVIEAGSWAELPEILEPGVYIVGGKRYVIRVSVSRDAFVKALKRKSRTATRI